MAKSSRNPENENAEVNRFTMQKRDLDWLDPMRGLINSALDVTEVLDGAAKEFDSEEVMHRMSNEVNISFLAKLTPRYEALSEALAGATFDLMDAVNFNRLEEDQDRELAIEFHKARLDKIASDFNLGDQERRKFLAYAATFFGKRTKSHHQFSLHSGLLSVLDGAFEIFIRQLMTIHYKQRDIPLELKELGLSYEEIKSCESPKEFIDLAVGRKVDQLISRNIGSWIDWLAARDKKLIDPNRLVGRAAVEDFHLARNVLLHEGGIVAARHVRVANSNVNFVVGKPIRPTADFVRKAVISYLSFAVSIWAMATSTTLKPLETSTLHNVIQVQLLRGRFFPVVINCAELWSLSEIEEPNQVNIWFADSRMKEKRFSENVENWEPMKPEFQLAKMLIQGKKSERKKVIALAQALVDSKQLSVVDVHSWPILESIRDELDLSERGFDD